MEHKRLPISVLVIRGIAAAQCLGVIAGVIASRRAIGYVLFHNRVVTLRDHPLTVLGDGFHQLEVTLVAASFAVVFVPALVVMLATVARRRWLALVAVVIQALLALFLLSSLALARSFNPLFLLLATANVALVALMLQRSVRGYLRLSSCEAEQSRRLV